MLTEYKSTHQPSLVKEQFKQSLEKLKNKWNLEKKLEESFFELLSLYKQFARQADIFDIDLDQIDEKQKAIQQRFLLILDEFSSSMALVHEKMVSNLEIFSEFNLNENSSQLITLLSFFSKDKFRKYLENPHPSKDSFIFFQNQLLVAIKVRSSDLAYLLLIERLSQKGGYPKIDDSYLQDVSYLSSIRVIDDHSGSRWVYSHKNAIGVGGSGFFVKAFDIKLRKLVGIKIITPNLAINLPYQSNTTPETKELALKEAQLTAALTSNHPAYDFLAQHIPHTYDAVFSGDISYLVFELLTPDRHLHLADFNYDTNPNWVPKRDKQWLLTILDQICGLATIFSTLGKTHHDLGPSNLFLRKREKGPPTLVVTDFGIAQTVAPLECTPGTLETASPEKFHPNFRKWVEDDFTVGLKSEVLTIAVVLLRLLGVERQDTPDDYLYFVQRRFPDFTSLLEPFNLTPVQKTKLALAIIQGFADEKTRHKNPRSFFKAIEQAIT